MPTTTEARRTRWIRGFFARHACGELITTMKTKNASPSTATGIPNTQAYGLVCTTTQASPFAEQPAKPVFEKWVKVWYPASIRPSTDSARVVNGSQPMERGRVQGRRQAGPTGSAGCSACSFPLTAAVACLLLAWVLACLPLAGALACFPRPGATCLPLAWVPARCLPLPWVTAVPLAAPPPLFGDVREALMPGRIACPGNRRHERPWRPARDPSPQYAKVSVCRTHPPCLASCFHQRPPRQLPGEPPVR